MPCAQAGRFPGNAASGSQHQSPRQLGWSKWRSGTSRDQDATACASSQVNMRSTPAGLADQLQARQLCKQSLVDSGPLANEDEGIGGLKSLREGFCLFDGVCEYCDAMTRELGEASKAPHSVLIVVGDDDIHRSEATVYESAS
jgi:hypothetical protein